MAHIDDWMSQAASAIAKAASLALGQKEGFIEPGPIRHVIVTFCPFKQDVAYVPVTSVDIPSCIICRASISGVGAARVCEEHCPDHDYEYDRDRRGHFCRWCDAQRPAD